MPCYSPLHAWRGGVLPSGKREILFKKSRSGTASVVSLKLPCGQCIGCRLERSRQWALRCVHEASLHDRNCFITLTYNDDNIPDGGSLCVRDFQLFMKRLRKYAHGSRIRFFHCGEYGDKLGRPHYHAIVFGFDFDDKVLYKVTPRGDKLYRSSALESLWTVGHSILGDVTFESAAYVARYCVKKVTGKNADLHYADVVTGELRKPEYTTMSRRPGIGRGWYDKWKADVFPRDYVVSRGIKMRPPKFYDGIYELEDLETFRSLKVRRISRVRELDPTGLGETGDRRLRVKEEVKLAQISQLSRNIEV